MEKLMVQGINNAVAAGWMIIAVIGLRFILEKLHAPKCIRLILWGLVAVRLALPFPIESSFSLMPGTDVASELLGRAEEIRNVKTAEQSDPNRPDPETADADRLEKDTDGANTVTEWKAEKSETNAKATIETNTETKAKKNAEANIESNAETSAEANTETTTETYAATENGKDHGADSADASSTDVYSAGIKSVREMVGVVWLIGTAAMLLYAVVSVFSLRRRVSVRMPYDRKTGQTGTSHGENHHAIYLTEGTDTPFILGILHPVIYLPAAGTGRVELTEEEYDLILAHEQAHIRNLDHVWKPLGFLLLALYWFQPLLWIAYLLFCRDIEFACDERVVQRLDQESVKAYMETLFKCSARGAKLAACPLAFGEVGVKARIRSVFQYKKPAFWVLFVGILACVVLAVTMLTTSKAKQDQDGESGLEVVEIWAEAMMQKDTETLAAYASAETQLQMQENLPLSFGANGTKEGGYVWRPVDSYPWPKASEQFGPCRYELMEDGHAIINYYVSDSTTSIVYVWTEELWFANRGENQTNTGNQAVSDWYVVQEKMTFHKVITDNTEFSEMLSLGGVQNSPLDYMQNGLGDGLLARYQTHDNILYEKLGNPVSALCTLLHLDEQKVVLLLGDGDGYSEDSIRIRVSMWGGNADCEVILPEYDEKGLLVGYGSYAFAMVRYGGEDGIWIPQEKDADQKEDEKENAPVNGELIRRSMVQLTNDAVADELSLYYDYSHEVSVGRSTSYEERVVNNVGVVVAEVKDGATGEVLFRQNYSADQVGNGILGLVHIPADTKAPEGGGTSDGGILSGQDRVYLFVGQCIEMMDEASYQAKLLCWEDGVQVEKDAYEGSFPLSPMQVMRSMEWREQETEGENAAGPLFPNGKDVTVGLQEFVSKYETDSELLIACDVMLEARRQNNGGQMAYIGVQEGQYTLEDYYQDIWNRYASLDFTLKSLENLFGHSAFYVDEFMTGTTRIFFYDGETGERLLTIGGGMVQFWTMDLDRDGKNELIAYMLGAADGRGGVTIFREEQGRVMCAGALQLLDPALLELGYDEVGGERQFVSMPVDSEYLPNTNQVKVYYWSNQSHQTESKIYEIDMEKLQFFGWT